MKNLLFILIISCSLNGFGQKKTFKITVKTLLEHSTFSDTTVTELKHSNGALYVRRKSYKRWTTFNGVKFQSNPSIKREYFRKDGTRKHTINFGLGGLKDDISYDKEGRLKKEFIYFPDETERKAIKLKGSDVLTLFGLDYDLKHYFEGRLVIKKSYRNKKKHGAWEYYDKYSGELIKKVEYENGKKK
jgi:antitoxin component YwqK of YwqJK toxin-antitoxin module